MSHTPGPWFVFLRNPENGMLHVGPPWHSVAWIIAIDDQKANANLIAAAPDMLQVLKDIDAASWEINSKLGERIRGAIRQAEGETK